MTQPPPSTVTDRLTGQTLYYNPYSGLYTRNRAYGLRMQRNFNRGITTQAEARGQRPGESQRRRARVLQQTGQTPQQQYQASVDARLRLYGGSWSWWQRVYRTFVYPINQRVAPGARIGIRDVESELANAWLTGHDTSWVEQRLATRLDAIVAYQDENDFGPGRFLVFVINANDPAPKEWWYYH